MRSPQEFSGELISPVGYEQEGAQRGGHIPGAASVPWAQAVREDRRFVLHELLGHQDVKNYDGSWTEWGNLVNVPIEKGS